MIHVYLRMADANATWCDQDFAGRPGLPISSPLSQQGTVWGKPLSPRFKHFANQSAHFQPFRPAPACGGSDCGSAAFLAPNGFPAARNTTVQFADLGYTDSTVRNLAASQYANCQKTAVDLQLLTWLCAAIASNMIGGNGPGCCDQDRYRHLSRLVFNAAATR